MSAFSEFKTSIDEVPQDFAVEYLGLGSAIKAQHRCKRCHKTYGGFDLGTLSCRYHPFEHVNTAQRFEHYSFASPAPGNCQLCNESHLDPYGRRAMHYGVPGNRDEDPSGCVPIDHADSVDAILDKPYACVPIAMADHFLLHDHYDNTNPFSWKDRNNVVLIHKPEQMALSVALSIPGTATAMVIPVVHLYEEVRSVFRLEDLQKTVRVARRGPNASSITRIKGMQHPDALDVYRLYANDAEANAEFMPFAVIARVHQHKPMELLDLPDLVKVLDDDDLV